MGWGGEHGIAIRGEVLSPRGESYKSRGTETISATGKFETIVYKLGVLGNDNVSRDVKDEAEKRAREVARHLFTTVKSHSEELEAAIRMLHKEEPEKALKTFKFLQERAKAERRKGEKVGSIREMFGLPPAGDPFRKASPKPQS